MINNSHLNSISYNASILIPMGKPEKDRSYRLFLVGLYRVIIPVNQLLRVFDLLINNFLNTLILHIIFSVLKLKWFLINNCLFNLLLSVIRWITDLLTIHLWDIQLEIVIVDIVLLQLIVWNVITAAIDSSYFLEWHYVLVVNASLEMI
jgi:hypothetical protein